MFWYINGNLFGVDGDLMFFFGSNQSPIEKLVLYFLSYRYNSKRGSIIILI